MTKQEIINRLEICTSIIRATENTYVTKQLKEITEALIQEWNESDVYFEQIKEEIGYEQRKNNLL